MWAIISVFIAAAASGAGARGQTTPAEFLKAIRDYSQVIEQNPKDASAYYKRALAYEAIGRDLLAIEDLSAFLKLNPKSADGFERRATIYFRIDEFARAGSDYAAAAYLDPRNAAARYGLGVTQRLDRFNSAAAADEHIVTAVAIQPDIVQKMAERGVR